MPDCEGTTKRGEACPKSAMGAAAWEKHRQKIVADPEMKGRLCYGCAVGGWTTMAAQGGRAVQSARRKKNISSVADVFTYDTILEVVAPALVATIEEPGMPAGTPDWTARLSACAVLVSCFPDYIRASPEETRELLDRLLPERVGRERLTPEAAYRALAEERHRLRERGHPLAPLLTMT